ncbi:hypothetical protein CYANOKiyG1_04560 [Okeania sp. KiyG1]|nr:hypothetical protein CYANOKiyG1_04560 [Okeania sp. KiyG1]
MAVEKTNSSSSLAEVVDRILDKGVVIDAWVRLSLVGIELLAIEARVVIASVETYLKYAEAVGLTALAAAPGEAIDFDDKPMEAVGVKEPAAAGAY